MLWLNRDVFTWVQRPETILVVEKDHLGGLNVQHDVGSMIAVDISDLERHRSQLCVLTEEVRTKIDTGVAGIAIQ